MERTPTLEDSDGDRKIEAPRTGARRVEEANAVDHFVVRQMAVSEHYDVCRLLGQRRANGGTRIGRPRKNVRQKNPQSSDNDAPDLHAIGIIIVAAYECDRRNLFQRGDHGIAADVAGVEDVIDAPERSQSLRTDQAVRVGDDADSDLMPRPRRASPNSYRDNDP